MEDTKHTKQMSALREQRKLDKQMLLIEKYEGDGTDADESLSVRTVNNDDRNDNIADNASDVSETDSYCRHCLRPQSELQLKYMRPRQRSKLRQQQHAKRERSKQRFSSYCVGSGSGNNNMSSVVGNQAQKTRSKKSRSKSRAKRARNNKHHSFSSSSNNKTNNNKEHQLKLPLLRDLNAANEQAIRFRCPQVGPQVGRDRQMPPMMHFHHPQHVQKQLTAYQVQYTHVYGQHRQQKQQQLQQQCFEDQQATSPMQTTTLTMESELKQQHQYQHHSHHLHHHHHHLHYCHQHNEHISNDQKSQQRHVTLAKDLAATNTITTATTLRANNLQNCCSSLHQPSQQTTQHQSPQCSSDYKQQQICCNIDTSTTASCCCYCSSNAMETTTQCYSHHHHHQHHVPHHQQHHNLPQLPLTHLETASATAVASLEASTLVVAATTTATATTACENTNIPSQVRTSPSLPPANEYRNLNINLNNPTTTEEDPSNMAAATTPDSPSLVKVSTWYTVAKQGVSC